MTDYLSLRRQERKSTSDAQTGPEARVGWMDARWIVWRVPAGGTKLDLVKFDTQGRPYVESKGAAAAGYKGPSAAQVRASLHL